MIKADSNIAEVTARLTVKLESLAEGGANEAVMIAIATTALSEMKPRIHSKGLNSNGEAIGEYSNNYLKLRKSKKYNRTGSKRVIFSLTRELENDITIVSGSNNNYSIGFNKSSSVEKVENLEKRYGKVYSLTEDERSKLTQVAGKIISELFNR